jgi:hypothetical protein
VLLPNDFPYHFDVGIEHYILWKIGANVTDEEVADAARKLKAERAPFCMDYVT